jgi:hypothetical protein
MRSFEEEYCTNTAIRAAHNEQTQQLTYRGTRCVLTLSPVSARLAVGHGSLKLDNQRRFAIKLSLSDANT